jgi:DNA modification methylase
MSAIKTKWPADHVERRPVSELIPYARNARTHSPAQVKQLVASMKEWGWTNPCLIDEDGGVIAGHGRILAAEQLGLSDVPVMVAEGWSKSQKRAYVLADNQLAMNADWDDEMLKIELSDLKLEGFDLDLIGFGDELTDLLDPDLSSDTDSDPDDLPDIPVDPHSKLGDTWVLGPHRIHCGDSTDSGDWEKLMQGDLADCQVCDPPYNVNYESDLTGKIKNDNMKDSEFRQFLLDFYTCSYMVMKPGAPMYVSHSDSEGINFRSTFIEAGFRLSGCLTWKKDQFVLGRLDYQPISEPILYGWKTGGAHKWYGGRKNITVQDVGDYPPFENLGDGRYAIRSDDKVIYVSGDAVVEEAETSMLFCPKPKRSPLHPTTKPVALWERLIRNSARRNDIIIDGFGGSGTTLMAAERLGMNARLMEFDPKFVDVICVRYAKYSGRIPVHAETGEPFPQSVIDELTASWGEVDGAK